MQDVIAIAVAVFAAGWLIRSLMKRLGAPPCQPADAGPPGTDGFIPLDTIVPPKQAGRPEGRPAP